jgi:membrane dipeptidase
MSIPIAPEAIALSKKVDIIDLHLDTLIPYRLWGYNPLKRHSRMPFGRHFFVHSDVPRLLEGGVTGGMWSITTNPIRPANNRWKIFLRNLNSLIKLCDQSQGKLFLAKNYEEYLIGKEKGASVVLPAIQGANAISGSPDGADSIPENLITRMTLVHLTPSVYGNTSSPFHLLNPFKGLKKAGKDLIEQMNHRRIFVDLAHAHPKTFFFGMPLMSTIRTTRYW